VRVQRLKRACGVVQETRFAVGLTMTQLSNICFTGQAITMACFLDF